MIAVKVIDALAVAALLFDEPEADAVAARCAGARLVAPSLLAFEIANVCVTKCRRYPEHREALRVAFQLRHQLDLEEIEVDHAAVLELALRSGLTAYDASYLWLARHLEADLITLDVKLGRAATAH